MISPKTLQMEHLPPGPFSLFSVWFDAASACKDIRYPHAACLATVSPEGLPEARMVLLHRFPQDRLCFFTDSRSTKGRALKQLPFVALTFHWEALERQIRIEGKVFVTSDELSDRMFDERPKASKIATWASHQSQPLESLAQLERQIVAADKVSAGQEEIPRPPYWCGYEVKPHKIEFWQAGARRMHDRIEYFKEKKSVWQIRRLSP